MLDINEVLDCTVDSGLFQKVVTAAQLSIIKELEVFGRHTQGAVLLWRQLITDYFPQCDLNGDGRLSHAEYKEKV